MQMNECYFVFLSFCLPISDQNRITTRIEKKQASDDDAQFRESARAHA